MAVDDFLAVPAPRETDSFVQPKAAFFPVKIPIAHYQLRHFISSPEPDLLYYASGTDVYCLNTATRTQAHIATLPWDARCTASGHGFVCVGGADDGRFASIKVEGFPPADAADDDGSLPLDRPRHTVPRAPILGTSHQMQLEKIGDDIVNSISIHKLAADGDGADDVVAVLTNNDKTVRVFSLTLNLEIAMLDLPFPVNHATISPDGQLLVAVGDRNVAYFFERVRTPAPSSMKTPEGRVQSIPPEWTLLEEVRLYVPPASSTEGYFTTAWSPAGRLCAVGSECGYITVFDMERLRLCDDAEDAVVQVIRSTRPTLANCPGAVRTMQFSPAPWDFLIWSEDQGRVCIADLRSGLRTRQVLTLDPKDEELEKIELADFDFSLNPELQALRREADFIRRYRRTLDTEGTAAAVDFATEYIEASSERRRLHRRLGVVESDDDPHGLTAQERQILESLRTTRQREEERGQGVPPRSINYLDSPERRYRIASLDHFSSLRGDGRTRERESPARDVPDSSLAELLSESARHAYLRRSSAVVSNERSGNGNGMGTGNITDSPTTRSPGLIPAYARRVDPQIRLAATTTDEAWRTIEEALARNSRAEAPGLRNGAGSDARTDRRLRQLTQIRERLRNAPETQALDAFTIGTLNAPYRRVSRSSQFDATAGVRTAGLAMSQDGRTLFCGTEDGIFEFQINVQERKGCPAITPR